MNESILLTIKKLLGIDASYAPFNMDIIIQINTALRAVNQLGIGTANFEITGDQETWADFLGENQAVFSLVKTYVYGKVRLVFDPPTSSSVMQALKEATDECEWRLIELADGSGSGGGGGGGQGTDGFSPIVTIATISGGHRITITDVNGDHVFDVLDGSTGSKGAKGDKGDKGDTGATGPQGPKGDTGETGATGPQGPKGDKGDKGDPGADGKDGEDGEDGYTPIKGVDYFDGAQGPKGDPGADGKDGEDGYTPVKGVDYFDGAKGDKGDKGDTGATGPQGPKGDDGSDGADGADGEDGITPEVTITPITGGHNVAFDYGSGDSRNVDFDVMDGEQGPQGETGATGATGATGPAGADGDDGITPTTTVTTIPGGHNVAFNYGTGDSRNVDFDVMDGDTEVISEVTPTSTQDGYCYYNKNGTVSSVTNGALKKVTIESGKNYYVTTSFTGHSTGFALISYFDDQDEYLSAEYQYDGSGTALTIENQKLNIPDNAAWFYVNSRSYTSHIYAGEFRDTDLDREISILFIGNSLTQDGIAYLPYVLKTYYPEVKFRLYMWYIPAYDLSQQYAKFNADEVCNIFSVAENTASWTNYDSSVKMSDVLSDYTFDIVCMQEYFNHKRHYSSSDATAWINCRDYIQENYEGGNGLEFVSLFHAPLRSKAYEIFTLTQSGNATILQNNIADDIIPTGIAVYRALSTALDDLGDEEHLSPDGTHTQEGLPCLLQTYVALIWLFDRLGINRSIYGLPMRMTTAIYNTLNVPGPNLGTGVITGTDTENLLAQEVAIQAAKEGRQFVLQYRAASVADDLSKLSEFAYGGKATLGKEDFENGTWSYSSKSSSGTRLRSKVLYPVKNGCKVKFTNPSFKVYFGTLLTKMASSYTSPSGWLSAGQIGAEYTIPIDGYTNIILESSDGSDVSLTDFDCSFEIIDITTDDIVDKVLLTALPIAEGVSF